MNTQKHTIKKSQKKNLVFRSDKTVHRGDVDDSTPVRLAHVRQRGARAEKYGREIERYDVVPPVGRELLDGRDELNAGVVHEHVAAAKVRDRLLEHSTDVRLDF